MVQSTALTCTRFDDGAGSWSSATNPSISLAPHIVTERWTNEDEDRLWLDSVARTGDPQNPTVAGMTVNRFQFGASRPTVSVSSPFTGYLSELLLYARALSTDEILRGEEFLLLNNGF